MLVSSHVLHEVERMAPRVVVLVNGRLVAEGETGASASSSPTGPARAHRGRRRQPRRWRSELVGEGLATPCASTTGVLVVETADVDALAGDCCRIARDLGATLARVEPVGDDLESVYTYLTDHARGRGR